MDSLLKGVEVEPVAVRVGEHDLTVDDDTRTERIGERLEQFGEVAVERAIVAAQQHDLIAVAEHDATEPVPLRLEAPTVAVGDRPRQLGQHRIERWCDGQGQYDRLLLGGHPTVSRIGREPVGARSASKWEWRQHHNCAAQTRRRADRTHRRRDGERRYDRPVRVVGIARSGIRPDRRQHRPRQPRSPTLPDTPTISVTGTAEVTVTPDTAHVSMGVRHRADSAKAALDTVSREDRPADRHAHRGGYPQGRHPDDQPVGLAQLRRRERRARSPGTRHRTRSR